jgi:hypothetical protein
MTCLSPNGGLLRTTRSPGDWLASPGAGEAQMHAVAGAGTGESLRSKIARTFRLQLPSPTSAQTLLTAQTLIPSTSMTWIGDSQSDVPITLQLREDQEIPLTLERTIEKLMGRRLLVL